MGGLIFKWGGVPWGGNGFGEGGEGSKKIFRWETLVEVKNVNE